MIELEGFERIAASVPYRPKGMFYSEVFAFLQSCQQRRVGTVIESGVKFGMSTKLLSCAWAGEIISIDRDPAALAAVYPGVWLMQGDSRLLLPKLLRAEAAAPARRVGVLIDGPKGAAARQLKDACLASPACLVVGIHDAAAGLGESRHTHDPQFAAARERLDRLVDPNWRRKYPMGPGLGLWEKSL